MTLLVDQVLERRTIVLVLKRDLGGTRKENIVAEFVILSWNLSDRTGENNELASLGYLISGPIWLRTGLQHV